MIRENDKAEFIATTRKMCWFYSFCARYQLLIENLSVTQKNCSWAWVDFTATWQFIHFILSLHSFHKNDFLWSKCFQQISLGVFIKDVLKFRYGEFLKMVKDWVWHDLISPDLLTILSFTLPKWGVVRIKTNSWFAEIVITNMLIVVSFRTYFMNSPLSTVCGI